MLYSYKNIVIVLSDYGNSIVFPERININTGEVMSGEKFVKYNGPYIRVNK